jgi:LysR family transcriptional activator of nhaA
MEWLNYHHLRYFWVVASEGSLAKASEKLHVSQPSISAQVAELEESLGVALFRRSGRRNVLTDAGQMVFGYADDIFALGRELVASVKNQAGKTGLRLYVGVADSFPKLLTNSILEPVFAMKPPVHVVCREGKLEDLLVQLAAHRLDIVLSDEPAPGSLNVKTFSHLLGECDVAFLASARLARQLKPRFPQSLDGAPALLPTENTGLRRSLEKWFHDISVKPNVLAEFEDPALMKVMAADGRGFIALPVVVEPDARQRYRFERIGSTAKCRDQFFAITAERRLRHPAVVKITEQAQGMLMTST